jgi:hypothetical protein
MSLAALFRRLANGEWNQAAIPPKARGWYVRDHRACPYPNPRDRIFSADFFEPDPDPLSITYPGVWYVHDAAGGLNDASYQNLPWKHVPIGFVPPVGP